MKSYTLKTPRLKMVAGHREHRSSRFSRLAVGFTDEQMDFLVREARRMNTPVAEMVRRSVDRDMRYKK